MLTHKYRPKTLTEFVGQKKIIGEFKNRTKDNNFPQVMIFEGDSGTGKTSLAYIVSKLLNCKTSKKTRAGIEPCNKCESCLDINNEKFARDVMFFDASSMGKSDILDLEKLVNYNAFYDQNKIIIIDEAQELSKAGKGATLKLLEKVRNNVYFILCTMDTKALDNAVKRRGQVYKFKPATSDDIAQYLFSILEQENIVETIDESFINEGLFTISESSYGSVGIAISNLERCIEGKIYSEADIINELGFINEKKTSSYLIKILKKDSTVFNDLANLDLKEVYFKMRKILKDALIYKFTKIADNDWKEKYLKSYIQYDISKLYSGLTSMNNIYFDEYKFYNIIFEYFNISTKRVRS